jgi:hypothetical protein
MWEEAEGGYQVHDYLEYQPSAASIKAERSMNSVRKQLYADPGLVTRIRKRDGDNCRYCGKDVRWEDRKGTNGATYDHVIPNGGNSLENIVVSLPRLQLREGQAHTGRVGIPAARPGTRIQPLSNRRGSRSDLDPINQESTTRTRPVPVPSRTPTHNPTVEENVSLSDAPTTETPKPKVITEAERTFGEFWALYPKGRGSKKLAAEEWKKLKAADWHEILAKLPIFTDCYDWQKEGGKYVKHAERWIKNRGWEDDVPTYVAPRPVNTKNNNPNAALALAAELRRTEQ